MKKNCCGTSNACGLCGPCGTCQENGRVWVDGYHGKKSLNFTTDSAVLQNTAAFQSYGINLSECRSPVIKATPQNIMAQLLNPVLISESRLTVDILDDNNILNDVASITSTGSTDASIRFNFDDIEAGFETFFQNTTTCSDLDVIYTVSMPTTATANLTNNSSGTFQVVVKLSFQKLAIELTSYTLTSNEFSLSLSSTNIT